jgi:hypothetical protein
MVVPLQLSLPAFSPKYFFADIFALALRKKMRQNG